MRNIFCFILPLLFMPTFIEAGSRPDSVFYRNDGVNIEYRILLEDQEKIPWIMLKDRQGTPHRVSKEIVIGNEDIAGFTIDDYKSDFDDNHGVIMHFEPNSWRKIREATGKLKGKRVALVRDGRILLSPIIYSALMRATGVYLGSTEKSVEEFLKDFPRENLPERLHSETLYEKLLTDWMASHPHDLEVKDIRNLSSSKKYEQFLVSWIDRHPEDLGTLRALVNHYFEDKNNPKCKKALAHARRFVKAKPVESQMQIRLMQCYQLMGNNEKSLTTGIQAISHAQSMEKVFLHRMVGELQYEMGNKKEAVKSIEASLEIMRQIKFPNIDDIDRKFLSEMSIQKLDGLVVPKKEEIIQETIDRINYILTH